MKLVKHSLVASLAACAAAAIFALPAQATGFDVKVPSYEQVVKETASAIQQQTKVDSLPIKEALGFCDSEKNRADQSKPYPWLRSDETQVVAREFITKDGQAPADLFAHLAAWQKVYQGQARLADEKDAHTSLAAKDKALADKLSSTPLDQLKDTASALVDTLDTQTTAEANFGYLCNLVGLADKVGLSSVQPEVLSELSRSLLVEANLPRFNPAILRAYANQYGKEQPSEPAPVKGQDAPAVDPHDKQANLAQAPIDQGKLVVDKLTAAAQAAASQTTNQTTNQTGQNPAEAAKDAAKEAAKDATNAVTSLLGAKDQADDKAPEKPEPKSAPKTESKPEPKSAPTQPSNESKTDTGNQKPATGVFANAVQKALNTFVRPAKAGENPAQETLSGSTLVGTGQNWEGTLSYYGDGDAYLRYFETTLNPANDPERRELLVNLATAFPEYQESAEAAQALSFFPSAYQLWNSPYAEESAALAKAVTKLVGPQLFTAVSLADHVNARALEVLQLAAPVTKAQKDQIYTDLVKNLDLTGLAKVYKLAQDLNVVDPAQPNQGTYWLAKATQVNLDSAEAKPFVNSFNHYNKVFNDGIALSNQLNTELPKFFATDLFKEIVKYVVSVTPNQEQANALKANLKADYDKVDAVEQASTKLTKLEETLKQMKEKASKYSPAEIQAQEALVADAQKSFETIAAQDVSPGFYDKSALLDSLSAKQLAFAVYLAAQVVSAQEPITAENLPLGGFEFKSLEKAFSDAGTEQASSDGNDVDTEGHLDNDFAWINKTKWGFSFFKGDK